MSLYYLRKFTEKLAQPIDQFANKWWYDYPFGKTPLASRERYEEIAKTAQEKEYPQVDAYEKETGFAIDKAWFNELALHTQVVVKKSEICYQHGRLLYSTLRKYLQERNSQEALTIIETGTARGFSSLCMSKALQDTDTQGKIITFDLLPHTTKMYWNCIDDHEGPKTRAELLKNYEKLTNNHVIFHQGNTHIELPKVQVPRVHFAFLDGQHDYKSVIMEFNHLKNLQKPGDIIFFDDYTPNQFPGVVKAIDEICETHNYKKHVITISNERGYVIATKQ